MKKNRLISLMLSIIMILGIMPVSAQVVGTIGLDNFKKVNSYNSSTYTDVNSDDWFYDNVKSAFEYGLMIGKDNNLFDTEGNVTIAETMTIAARLHSIYYTGKADFAQSDPWYQIYADYCKANNIIANSANYDITASATRTQFAQILANAMPDEAWESINKVADNAIPDVKMSDGFSTAVYKLYRAGVLVGNDANGTFAPDSNIRRCEVAALVTRMADVSLRKSIKLGNEYTVSFNLNYSGKSLEPVTVFEGEKVAVPAIPERIGYTFRGWYTLANGGNRFDFDTEITSDVTLYAQWNVIWIPFPPIPAQDTYYTVTFDSNGGSAVASQKVKKGECASEPINPVNDGFTFIDWCSDADLTKTYDFNACVEKNITLYAKWAEDEQSESHSTLSIEIKEALGLAKDSDDSDGDGLTDYDELIIVGTDPAIYDTDNDGVCDSDDDEDGDGLSNIQEVQLKTLPTEADSDFDGLNDWDEVNTYETDPLNADSDSDGLSDGEEIKLGLDPMNPKTFGYPDAERTMPQTASNESVMDEVLFTSDNWLTPSIGGDVAGDINNNIFLERSSSSAFNENRSVLSDVIDLSTNYENIPLEISFAFNEADIGMLNTNNLTIASFGEDGLEIVDTKVEEGKISGEIIGSGTYFVIDLDAFLKGLGIDVLGNIVNPILKSAPYASKTLITSVETSISSEEQNIRYIYGNFGEIVGEITEEKSPESPAPLMKALKASKSATKSDVTGKADVVFVIDTTGSMSDAIYGVKDNVNVFAEKLVSDYNIDANFALIEFRDINVDGLDSTKIHKNLTSNWFTNASVFGSEVDSLYVDGGGDWEETPIDGLEMARRLDWRKEATKFVVLVTDAPYWNDNRYGISNMESMAQLLENDGIIVSAISYEQSIYQNLTDTTDGLYGYIYGNFSEILLKLAEKVGEATNADGEWVFLDDFQAVKLSNTLDNVNTNDTDDDGLTDAQELGQSIVVDMLPYITSLTNRYDVPVENYQGRTQITVWKYLSNPVRLDTDYDGNPDKNDSNPKIWDISDRDLAIAAGISYTDLVKGTKIDTLSISLDNGASVSEMIGWTVLDTWHGGAGFYAAALKKDKNIVLAFRGSKGSYDGFIDIDWIDDWVYADVINVLTGISTQAPAAQAFTEKILNNYSGYSIYICGHSLGGNLALNASIKALKLKPSAVKHVSTFNGLGMPNVKVLTELFTSDLSTLASYKERFNDYEIEGDPVSAFELNPEHKWYDIFDVALTTGVGSRLILPLKVNGNAHGLGNFYLQMAPLGRPIG